MRRIFSGLLILGIMVVLSCKKPPQYPDIPTLSFKSLNIIKNSDGYDRQFHLTCTFTDGDGDIGYNREFDNGAVFDSTSSPYYYNYVTTLSILEDGVWVDTTFQISNRIMPSLTPEGKNKSIKGDIDKLEDLPINLDATIRFNVFIYDRALNKSNVVTTPSYTIHS